MNGSTLRKLSLVLLAAALAAACQPSDPTQKILEERARWDVRVLSWAQEPDGTIKVSTRVSGPPASKLAQLTARVDLLDAADATVGDHWQVFDLAQVPRGGPSDLMVIIPDPGAPVEGLALNLMLEPTEEERGRIVELAE
jgi:hypothetical protein